MFKNLIKEYQEGYIYLFTDKDVFKKLWLLPLLLIFPLVKYPFGIVFIKGWQVQMVFDLVRNKPLQHLNFGNVFLKGMQIAAITMIYLTVPTILCYVLGLKGIVGFLLDIWEFITGGLKGYLADYIQDYIITFLIYGMWGLISNPLIQCGIIHYAISNDWKDLIHLPKNLLFLIKNWHHFIKFYLFYLITLLLLVIIESVLLVFAFPIELILAPFLLVLYYGSVSHELGHLAKKFYTEKHSTDLSLEIKESQSNTFLINNPNKEFTMASEKTLFSYFVEGFTKNYFNFNGRAGKREYWGFTLFSTIASFVLLIIAFTGIGLPALIIYFAMIPASIAVSVRRLHDANKSGWFALSYLIMLIPSIGELIALVIMLVIGVLDGTKGENQYGSDPINKAETTQ